MNNSLMELNGFNTNKNDNNKKSIIFNRITKLLLGAILLVIIIFFIVIKLINNDLKDIKKADIEKIVKNKETQIIYVGSYNSKKCSKCQKVIDYLNKQNINYQSYIVDDYNKKEYNKTLELLNINPDDFGYPAVMYIRDGKLFSNVINIDDIKSLDAYVKSYELQKVNKNS